jgi:lipopolysaccharide/colanic/teichoic acid biosynthesis glycosyltransferase
MVPPLRDVLYRAAKRALDVGIAATGLGVLALPMAAAAIAIKLDSPGPVFYRGERVGLHGRIFRIFKFRSMRVHRGGPDTTSLRDDRITRVGHFIRRYKIDELPQLINVLLGQMSLVGPRPEVQSFVDMYTEKEEAILAVRPGITDWSSIKFHNEGEIVANSGYADPDQAYLELIRPEKLRLQLKYVREQSLTVDFKILWSTIALIGRKCTKGQEAASVSLKGQTMHSVE